MSDPSSVNPAAQGVVAAPGIVLGLIFVLAAIHGALWFLGEVWIDAALSAFAFFPPVIAGTVAGYYLGAGWVSFFSHAFLHADWMHLFFNGLWLLVFGSAVARRMGAVRFLLIFLLAAAAGAGTMLVFHWGEPMALIGASGGVSGLLAAAVPVMYAEGVGPMQAFRRDVRQARVPALPRLLKNRQAMMFVALWIGLTLLSGSTGLLVPGEPRLIAWEAHLGGFLAGLPLFYLLDRNPLPVRQNL